MFCPVCGKMIPDGSAFCPECGSSTTVNANPGNQQYANPGVRDGGNFTGYVPTKRELVTCIILSLVTCGIYMYYWMYKLNDDMGGISGRQEMSSGMVVLLSIVTCGIYAMIWSYQQGQKVDELKKRNGLSTDNTALVYLLLTIFGFSIITVALMQNEVNGVAEGRYRA